MKYDAIWLLFCILRVKSPVPRALPEMILWLLELMKHIVKGSLLLFQWHATWLGKLYLQETYWEILENFW